MKPMECLFGFCASINLAGLMLSPSLWTLFTFCVTAYCLYFYYQDQKEQENKK